MKIGTLKKLINNIPDNVEISISDMENFSSDFVMSTYYEGDTYVDLIMPIYIHSYNTESSEETIILN